MASFTRRSLLFGPALAIAAPTRAPRLLKNVLVYRQSGRFGGWPANHGIWSWGDEILVGFASGYFMKREWMYHQIDSSKPEVPAFARSTDGGLTWKIREEPDQILPRWGGKEGQPLAEPIDFTHPGFAWTLRFNNSDIGPTIHWYSLDRGATWRGPYAFPSLDLPGISGRPNYLVLGKREALVLMTAAKANKKEGRVFCARTRDGGLHWELVSYVGPEPDGFAIMPAILELPQGKLMTAVRRRERGEKQHDWIETYVSPDRGRNWTKVAPVTEDTGRGGNPASLTRLPDGRICAVYGYRNEPYSIRARITPDEGKSWGPDILLREGGKAPDLGYPRSILRPDGKIVTAYYFNDDVHNERFIEAAIWDPGA